MRRFAAGLALTLSTQALAQSEVHDPGKTRPPFDVGSATCPARVDVVGPMRANLTCESFCDPDAAPRSSLQRISWLDDPRGRSGESRLDVSVYKTGFAEGAYASLCRSNTDEGMTVRHHLEALADEASMRFVLTPLRPAQGQKAPNVLVVKDLQPGVAYFWRAAQRTKSGWVASPVRYCMAAVCPVDYVDEDLRGKEPPRRPPSHVRPKEKR